MLLSAALALGLASCGPEIELSLKEDTMPQQVYVLGQELDLSGGVLLVKEGDGVRELEMDDEGVSVSGYDKDKAGEQQVTLTYGGKTVELTVTVVPRMQVIDYATDYLEGDSLDLSVGRVKITRDDGSNYTVIFGSDKVSITGFNSDTTGKKTLTATYVNGSDNYSASFDVNVHEIESVDFTSPNKVAYNSHDTEINVAGGKFTLKGNGGKLEKVVEITADMTEGFDLTAATEAHRTTPLEQTIYVEYRDGVSDSYEIEITYTDISLFKKNASLFKNLDFTGEETPDITKAQGDTAIYMMELYLDMSPAEKALISRTDTMNTARAAMVYAYDLWYVDFAEFDAAFRIDEYGSFAFVCESEAALEAAIDGLKVYDRPVYEYSDILIALTEAFATEEIIPDVLFGDQPILDPELYAEIIDIFEYMLELDALMDLVPEDWATEGINTYADEVADIFDCIVNSDYYNYVYTELFYYVSMWRAEDDAFDFLYEYYFGIEDAASLISLANIRLPAELDELFTYVAMAMDQINMISQYAVADTSQFFYCYYKACQLADDVVKNGNEMIKTLFYGIPLNGMLGLSTEGELYTFDKILEYIRTAEGGYYHFSGGLLGNDTYHALMDKYMEIIDKRYNDEDDSYKNSAAYSEDVEAMLALYISLSPTQQFNFLGAINVYYAMSIPPYSFDASGEYEGFSSLFADILKEYYESKFEGEEAKALYVALMVATEAYAQRFTNVDWYTTFTEKMGLIETLCSGNAMSQDDKDAFDLYLGYIYDKYVELGAPYADRPEIPEEPDVDLGEWADEFEEMREAVVALDLSYTLIQSGYNFYSLFFSAYEKLEMVVNQIMEAPDNIKKIYFYEELYSNKELDKWTNPDWVDDDPSTTVYWTYDYMVSNYRTVYVSALNTILSGQSAYDYYFESTLDEFLLKNYDLLWALMWSTDADVDVYDKDKVLDVLNHFRGLSADAQFIFLYYFEGEMGLYYQALAEFLDEDYSATVADAANKLIALEMALILYENIGEEALADVEQCLAELKAVNLTGNDATVFDGDFGDAYDYYVGLAETAIEEAASNDSAE